MEPKGVCNYILDEDDKWIPWTGNSNGNSANVVLYDVNGRPIADHNEADVNKALNSFNNEYALSVSGQIYVLDSANSSLVGYMVGLIQDADALPNDLDDGYELQVANRNYGFNGTTWDRTRSFAGNADDIVSPTLGLAGAAAFGLVYDGTNWDRQRSLPSNADAQVAAQVGLLGAVTREQGFNGATYDRLRTQSLTNSAAATQSGVLLSTQPAEWTNSFVAALNTRATTTRAAVANARHICTMIYAKVTALPAIAAGPVVLSLRDGISGAGASLFTTRMLSGGATSTTAQSDIVQLSGMQIVGSTNTAMTLEFDAAAGPSTYENLNMTGYDVA